MARPRGRSRYTLRETTADVLALLDAAGLEGAHVVGHDWGGLVAWALASWHPDRVRTLTALSVPHPAAMSKAMVTSDQALRSSYVGLFQLPLVPEQLLLAGGGAALRRMLRSGGLPDDAVEHYVARMREPRALSSALGWYRALPGAGATRWAGSACRRCTCGAPATPSSGGRPPRPPRSSWRLPTGSRCSTASATGSPNWPPTAWRS
ncbi:alpha/beta fold hydrolase [Blastococcus brunescens]|uniref:Alpha/beta fold hydrolase n=1 Tax=Blastococcus brunescens TaxID=1564165 RepID=A0ABZ1B5U2_9ACTN|nr:alpha/beta fold hydrolase [Blastococcus sp. BMG 8361]WRL65213.1 alpha/beta fold hydrolase [Blastococcus sp. BMG 8361]